MDIGKLRDLFMTPTKSQASDILTNGNGRQLGAAAAEEYSCEFGSAKYFTLCGFGGVLSCGITHTAVTPLDLVKCRLQVNKEKYKSLGNGFKVTVADAGARGLVLGWAPTAIGYSMQGFCNFYSNLIGEENTYLWRTSLYLAASASAEFFADIALSPMESVKFRIQTSLRELGPLSCVGAHADLPARCACRPPCQAPFQPPSVPPSQSSSRRKESTGSTNPSVLCGGDRFPTP